LLKLPIFNKKGENMTDIINEVDSNKNNGRKKNYVVREILDWAKYIIIAVIFALIITNYVIVNALVPTGSMETTIMTGDRVIASRLSYLYGSPKRGDIVVFKYPDDEKENFTKRVIGLPGDTVEVKEGNVYISGKKIDEPYLHVKTEGEYGPFLVPQGSYFMMGDNRNDSLDSRFWKNKYVKRNKILAKVEFEYFPKIKYLGQ
jgi:signal peptidase I